MFCPKCKDEFRPGFDRCGRCNVDLVADLPRVGEPRQPPPEIQAILRLENYCGFLALDDARDAREKLREQRIPSEIVIRDAPGSTWEEPAGEEFWLRVDARRLGEVPGILGAVPHIEDPAAEGAFACGECGQMVAADATACPGCRARFD